MKKRMTKILAAGMALALMVGTFAYFTDRVEQKGSVTGGTVGITADADANWTNQLKAGPQSLDNINPGDSRSLAFTVTNTGTKAVDVRHTIKLSVVDAAGNAKAMTMGKDVAENELLQFDIYKASDVTTMSGTDEGTYNAGYVLKAGAKPVFSTSTKDADTKMGVERDISAIDKGIVTYYFADSILDGTGLTAETNYAKAEQVDTELAATDAALVGTTAVKYDYVLIFRDTTLNDFQGCKLHAELVVEAKQHLNTNSSWQNIETVEYNMVISGETAQDTTINTAPNNQTGVLEDVTDATSGTYNTNTQH